MPRYEERVIDLTGPAEIEGRITEVLQYHPSSRKARVLVEANPVVPSRDRAGLSIADIADAEGVTFEEAPDEEQANWAYEEAAEVESQKSVYLCNAEKADGEPCTREVEQPDERCWQHEEDND